MALGPAALYGLFMALSDLKQAGVDLARPQRVDAAISTIGGDAALLAPPCAAHPACLEARA